MKRSAENRGEKAEKLNKLAASQFQNYFTLQSDRAAKQLHGRQLENLKAIEDRYISKRQFKRKEKGPEDVMSRVRITLMEYGIRDFTAKTNVDIAEIDEANEQEDVFGKILEKTEQEVYVYLKAMTCDSLFDFYLLLFSSLILISYSKIYQLPKR